MARGRLYDFQRKLYETYYDFIANNGETHVSEYVITIKWDDCMDTNTMLLQHKDIRGRDIHYKSITLTSFVYMYIYIYISNNDTMKCISFECKKISLIR